MSGDYPILEYRPWESEYAGGPVYQLFLPDGYKPNFMTYRYTLVPVDNVDTIEYLKNIGYSSLVEVVNLSAETFYYECSNNIRTMVGKDLEQLKLVALNSFGTSRLSSSFGSLRAGLMHSNWLENCYNKSQADEVLVYDIDSIPVGFIAVKVKDSIGNIVLIAVESKFRGRGIGKELIMSASSYFKCLGLSTVNVRTESLNTSAIKAYESCGFKIISRQVYLGKWT